MKHELSIVFTGVILITIGLILTLRAREIQKRQIDVDKGSFLEGANEGPLTFWSIRLVGLIMIVAGILCIVAK